MALTLEQALGWVDTLYRTLSDRRSDIERNNRYYRGEQRLVYATDEWKKFHEDRYRDFADNWTAVVANSPVERLGVDGFRVGDDSDVLSADERGLWDDWRRNDMEAQSSQGFLASTVSKRSAVIVWGRGDDEPVVSWESPDQVAVAYSTEDRTRLAALKAWLDGDRELATLYTPDALWKFERPAFERQVTNGVTASGLYVAQRGGDSGWRPREIPGERWPLRNPLGEVPVVEFLNRPMLGGEPLSDVSGTIAMQDAINLLWAYLFNAADHASMAARVVLGAEPPKVPILNDAGQVVGQQPAKLEDLAQGRLLFLPGVDGSARIDQWPAADLDKFTRVIEQAVGHIAAQTRTPPHYLVSNKGLSNLSGDALTAAETGLVKKVEEAQLFYTAAVRDVFRLMARVRGNNPLAESIRLGTVLWKDAENRSQAQAADAAIKDRQVGLPLAFILERRFGLSQTEIDRVLRLVREEANDPLIGQILAESQRTAASGDAAPVGE